MKRIISGLLASVLLIGGLAGCNTGGKKGAEAKTGFAVYANNSADHQKAPEGDKAGEIELNTYAAAALVDGEGKVIQIRLDAVQTKFEYGKDGVTTPDTTTFKTKRQKGSEYGMKAVSEKDGIGKEWNEQADAFEAWAVGKTADEIRKVAVNEEGAPTDETLKAGVTIGVDGLKEVAARAVENAKSIGATSTDTLGFGIVADAHNTKAEKALQYTTYAVSTFDKDGKITSTILDSTQASAEVADGKVTTDLAKAEVKTKKELGSEYGMKAVSEKNGIGKEWDEQAIAFENYVKGKTAKEVGEIKLTDDGAVADTDLAASVSVTATNFVEAYKRAGADALERSTTTEADKKAA